MEQYEIELNLNKNEVIKKLQKITGSDKGFMPAYKPSNANKKLLGKIKGNSFLIRLKYLGRNSFAANLIGNIEQIDNKTIIKGRYYYYKFLKPFKIIWFTFLIFFLCIAIPLGIFNIIKNKSINSNIMLIIVPILMFIFGYFFFKYGENSYRKEIININKILNDTFGQNKINGM